MADDIEEVKPGVRLIIGGFATLVFWILAFAAFDDITTDNATSFKAEYFFLSICALWGLFLSTRLTLRGYRFLGILSGLMFAATVWGQRGIGPGTVPGWWPEYVATVTGLLWFLVLSGILVVMGFRLQRGSDRRGGRTLEDSGNRRLPAHERGSDAHL
jgi:hypothetical protein